MMTPHIPSPLWVVVHLSQSTNPLDCPEHCASLVAWKSLITLGLGKRTYQWSKTPISKDRYAAPAYSESLITLKTAMFCSQLLTAWWRTPSKSRQVQTRCSGTIESSCFPSGIYPEHPSIPQQPPFGSFLERIAHASMSLEQKLHESKRSWSIRNIRTLPTRARVASMTSH